MQRTLTFTVDSALLRELGERLVGRQHIALAELVKNAYDADAHRCEIVFDGTSIRVADDGRGMDLDSFQHYWMRIGSTHKERWERSPRGRPLTGSKGVGRLAVQFLARRMSLRTTSIDAPHEQMTARLDWDEAQRTGDLVEARVACVVEARDSAYAGGSPHGFEILLESLRHEWSAEDFKDLAREIWMLRPPFSTESAEGDAFEIDLDVPSEHLKSEFERLLGAALDNWLARITCSVTDGRSRQEAIVTAHFRAGYGRDEPGTYTEIVPLPVFWQLNAVPDEPDDERGSERFQIDRLDYELRIYKLQYRQPEGIPVGEMRKYLAHFGGVHIYDAGFRLPFYDVRNDWLRVEYDHAHRLSVSRLLPKKLQYEKMLQDLPTNSRIFGVVQVSTGHEVRLGRELGIVPGHYLTINPGRDRLVDNEAYRQVQRLVRWGLDYYTSCYRKRRLEAVTKQRPTERPSEKLHRVRTVLVENRAAIPQRVYHALTTEIADYVETAGKEEAFQESFFALLGPLATAGMVSLALNHEMGRQLSDLEGISRDLALTASETANAKLQALAAELSSWARRMRDIRRLFAPLGNDEDRRDIEHFRARPLLRDVLDGLEPFLGGAAIDTTAIPDDFRLPPAPYAEWNALFQNIVINAVNAMIDTAEKRLAIGAGHSGKRSWLRFSDTGVGLGVPLDEAERLFEPFQRRLRISTDRRSLGLGGQGLGLTIVRMIAENRKARVAFVEPPPGFSTAFELSWGR